MQEGVREAQCQITIGPPDDPEVKFYYFPLSPAPTVLQVIADLGIPDCPAESCVSIITTGAMYGDALKDYTAEYFGLWVFSVDVYHNWLKDRGLGDHYPSSSIYYPNPEFKKIGIDTEHAIFWRRRVFYHAEEVWKPDDGLTRVLSPTEPQVPYLEAIWSPRRGDSLAVRGLEKVPVKSRVLEGKRILKGMPLITFRPETRGRKHEYESKKDFLADLNLARQLVEEQGRKITQESVAEYFRCDPRRIRTLFEQFDMEWVYWLRQNKD